MSETRARDITRFQRKAGRKNKRTGEIYAWAANRLDLWLTAQGDQREFSDLSGDDLDDFLDDFRDGEHGFEPHSAAYVWQIYRSLVRFYAWVCEEYVLPISPMDKATPREPGDPDPAKARTLREEQLVAVLDQVAYDRKDFYAIRDHALLRLLLTGPRRSELIKMTLADLDLDNQEVRVFGKPDKNGPRIRLVAFGEKTQEALERYLVHRAKHPDAAREELWLGKRGPLRGRGLHRMVEKRCQQAGITGVHPHIFRRTAAHMWYADGGSEADLMENMGWSSVQMPRYYARELKGQRARDDYRRRAIDDRI